MQKVVFLNFPYIYPKQFVDRNKIDKSLRCKRVKNQRRITKGFVKFSVQKHGNGWWCKRGSCHKN